LKECVLTVISRNSKKKKKVKIKEGDGAFYGPKIDITIMDNHKREQQCGTIQLDFNLPSQERFNLQYTASDQSKQHPIIIHRAILGSLERFIGIMLEHTQGKLPFWLSPRQIGVTTVNKEYNQYAEDVVKRLRSDLPGVRVDFDKDVTDDLRNQIKHMTSMRYNVIVTIGQNEKDDGTITFRSGKSRITKTYDDFVSDIKSILTEYRL
jgi:threonyl-tRNA synthetase